MQDYIERTVIVIPDSPADIQASEYVGEPSPELDAAWYRLLRRKMSLPVSTVLC